MAGINTKYFQEETGNNKAGVEYQVENVLIFLKYYD